MLAAPDSKQLARQLYEENVMPIEEDDDFTHNINNRSNGYDQDNMSPLESEFKSLMTTFLTYTEQDIRSLTSTSCRYLDYATSDDGTVYNKGHNVRSKEIGIRYRALFEGVQSGAREPAVLKSFSVLFEDCLPIRLAGRRIYNYLGKVIEEIRLERQGEVNRAIEMCNLDRDVVEYARNVWDMLMDTSLFMEDSLNSNDSKQRPQDVGVLSLSQLIHLGVVTVLVDQKLVQDQSELQSLFESAIIADKQENPSNAKHETREMTFVSFITMLHQCLKSNDIQEDKQETLQLKDLLKQLEQHILEQRNSSGNVEDTSTLLTKKAIHSGSDMSCKKRQRHSDRFDEYVSTFKIWEERFVGSQSHPSRRLDILRGCFSGARDAKVVAGLKIVYMDYAALRLAGDLIFKLVSKIAG
ncbi:hypothetical protein ACHAXN_010582 [Cyclotella atomus]